MKKRMTIDAGVLRKALASSALVSGRGSQVLQVLTHARLDARPGTLRIESTDIDRFLTIDVPAAGDGGWVTLVPLRTLTDLASKLKGEIELTPDGQDVLVACGTFEAVLNGMATDEWPTPPTLEVKQRLTLPGSLWRETHAWVAPSASAEISRLSIFGVGVRCSGHEVECVATDSKRLSRLTTKLDAELPQCELHIARDTMAVIAKLFGEEETTDVAVYEGYALVHAGSASLWLRQVGAEFIFEGARRVTPTDHERTFECSLAELAESIERIRVTTSDEPRVTLAIGDARIEMRSEVTDRGASRDELRGTLEGTPLEIVTNGGHLLHAAHALMALGRERVRIGFGGNARAIMLDSGDGRMVHMAMPYRAEVAAAPAWKKRGRAA